MEGPIRPVIPPQAGVIGESRPSLGRYPRMGIVDANDETIAELRHLVAVIDDTIAQLERVRRRADEIEHRRVGGDLYRVIVEAEERPLIVESLSDVLDRLSSAAGRFRRAEATALAAEGWTHERIGQFFGVTRQRIGILLSRERVR
ncbi:hypothetical protein [Pseudofrankia inefficax]|uniref:hypothetical protein n=1 Tax=Pseudofrankia inefficax (strain DSM 45817 / CECT 9037 / DDB 130130 / EuI1c) TaxID=298654 RepID=UPI0001BFA209|nr:hypothetical protein [Pseudofrankia inefficax]